MPIQDNFEIEDQTIAIAGQLLRNLTDSQITKLITQNTVLLDGESIQVLLDRDLGNLLHIQSAKWHAAKSGYQSFEQADGVTVQGVKIHVLPCFNTLVIIYSLIISQIAMSKFGVRLIILSIKNLEISWQLLMTI